MKPCVDYAQLFMSLSIKTKGEYPLAYSSNKQIVSIYYTFG
jgi:hypothetical protein